MSDKTILTSIGHITLPRRRYRCGGCGASQVPWDAWAGMGHRSLTPGAQRMVTLAGMSWSFDTAQKHLKELCHLSVSDDTIERVCQEQGQAAERFLRQSPAPVEAFAKARGHEELTSDGVKINTVDGWREMRLSVIAKRVACRPCAPAQWDQRVLERPTVRLASCAIAPAHRVGAGWARQIQRLGINNTGSLSMIADGAAWIWDQAAQRLGSKTQWCVDVYHVSEHVHGCGKALFGEGVPARQWADERLRHVLEHDGVGLIRRLNGELAERIVSGSWNAAQQEAVRRLVNYLSPHAESLGYRQRLAAGLPIGSGLIEGACKNMIGRRLKANAARWRVRRAERIGALRALDYSDQWANYWDKKAA